MRILTLFAIFFTSSVSMAGDTNSDLYMRCPKERAEMEKFENGQRTNCMRKLAELASCCNLKTCKVAGISAAQSDGNVNDGLFMVKALQALAAGISRNAEFCENGTFSADVECRSKEKGATAYDKSYIGEWHQVEGRFDKCMKAEKAIAEQQIVQAGGVAVESGGVKPGLGDNATEKQMLQGLQSK